MNAPHEEAVEFAKISKRENRVYVGNLSYDVKYRDLMEFMRGGGLGNLRLDIFSLCEKKGGDERHCHSHASVLLKLARFLEKGSCSCWPASRV